MNKPADRRYAEIITGPTLEFVQPPDQLARIRQVVELGLGNFIGLSAIFHVGNSDEERAEWKVRYPEWAAQIDALPSARNLPIMGSPAILSPLPEELLLEEVRLCRELGLYFECPSYVAQGFGSEFKANDRLLREVRRIGGEYLLHSCVLGENTSSLGSVQPYSYWQEQHGMDPESMNLRTMRDWFLEKDRAKVRQALRPGLPVTTNVEATVQFRLAMELGVQVPILEFVPSDPAVGIPAARGAARAYDSPYWGVALAMGWFRAPLDDTLPARLRIAYNYFFAAGASYFDNINCPFHIHGAPSGFFTEQSRPPFRAGEPEFRDFDDPLCADVRQVMREFARFAQFHRRPAGNPRVAIGFMLGHLDSYCFGKAQSHVWGVGEPGWEVGDAERTWDLFRVAHDTEPWYPPPEMYYWQKDPVRFPRHGTPPFGQVDIVPMEAPLSVLKSYRCLVFLGWNTMTPDVYEKLKDYVRGGGRLLMSLPHLSAQVHRKPELELIHDGDLRDLFGVRVTGKGENAENVRFVSSLPSGPYHFPEAAFYIEGAPLARVELAGAEVVAESVDPSGPVGLAKDGAGEPLLVQHRLGKGFAYLFTTWMYPGPHVPALLTDVLRTIVDAEQGDIALEGQLVSYSVYDDKGCADEVAVVYAANMSLYDQPQIPTLIVRDQRVPLWVDAHGMRIAWVGPRLIVSPRDLMVRVDDMKTHGDICEVELTAKPGRHEVQLEGLGSRITEVRLDDRPLRLKRGQDGTHYVSAVLKDAHRLRVGFGGARRLPR
ncbi:MAG: hypothetical protein Q7T82_06235 [Armatimonadota bacterium]|nr:hypothetical protein [Armatimonadota bacterium]